MFWMNGGTSGGNMDLGIYSLEGTLLVSTGVTARSGLSTAQYVNVDYVLPPGAYYLGQSCSATTGMIIATGTMTAIVCRMQGLLQEDLGSTVLPNTMTPATYTGTVVPVAGFTLSPSW